MPEPAKFSLKARGHSFRYAIAGLATLLRDEHNARIHLAATIAVALLGFIVDLNSGQWLAIVIAISMVWAAEAFNTAIEALCDYVCTEQNPNIGKAKDIAAGAVLVTSIGAAIVGLIVFIPAIFG